MKNYESKTGFIVTVTNNDMFGTIKTATLPNEVVLLSLNDCASVLEYKDVKDAAKRHIYDDYKVFLKKGNVVEGSTAALNNNGEMFITREGLIQLVQSSKMPKAIEFNRWVLEKLIPKALKHTSPLKKIRRNSTFKLLQSMDPNFKKEVQEWVTKIAREKATVKGYVWKLFNRRYNILFNTNLNKNKKQYMKLHGIKKNLTAREFLDLVGEQKNAIMCLKSLIDVPEIRYSAHELGVFIGLFKTVIDGVSVSDLKQLDEDMDRLHNEILARMESAAEHFDEIINNKIAA